MPKNILILTPFYPPNIGGAETFTEGLVKEASRWNHITVLTFHPFQIKSKPYEEYYSSRGSLKIYRMAWWVRQSKTWQGTGWINVLSVFPNLMLVSLFLLIKKRYQIIHAQGLLSGFVAVLLKKLFKVKVFITLLALYEFEKKSDLFNECVYFVLKNCDIIFVEGENGKKDIEIFKQEEKVRVFQHWVDQDIFKPPRKRYRDKIRVLFIGRPIPEKGRHIVEGAERLLNDKRYEFTYVTETKYSELPKIYQAHHICCVPSLYAEGFSRVVAEASSCGCAVITSNRGSLPEMTNGWAVSIEPTTYNFSKSISEMTAEILHAYQVHSFHWAEKYFNSKNSEVFLNEYSR